MLKKIFYLVLIYSALFSQNATQYLPTGIGLLWNHNSQGLDSLSNPTGPVIPIRTANIAYQTFLGKTTLIQISTVTGQGAFDTTWLAPEFSNVFVHMDRIKMDSITIGNFPDWLNIYRFASPINTTYTIHQVDTTITYDSTSLPLRIKISGKKLANESVTVPYGTFNCAKFLISFLVQLKITLPPPLPPFYQTLFDLPSTYWFADSIWEVKHRRETVSFTIPTTTRTITILGVQRELTSFGTIMSSPIFFTKGWNLISVPLASNNMSKTFLFPTSVSQAYAYNNGYIISDTLRNGQGYWLKFDTTHYQLDIGEVKANRNINVFAGWNLIGPMEKNVPISQIVQNPSGIVQSNYYGYSNAYVITDTLKIGKGYWVKVSQDGVLTLPTNILSNKDIFNKPFYEKKRKNIFK